MSGYTGNNYSRYSSTPPRQRGVITMRDEVEVEQADRITEAVMRLMARDTTVTMSSRPKRETWDKPEHTIETDTQIQGRTIHLIAGITKHNHPPGTTMVQIRTTYRNVAIVKIRTAGPRAPRKKIMTKKSQVQIPEHAGRSSTPTTDERWQHQQQKW